MHTIYVPSDLTVKLDHFEYNPRARACNISGSTWYTKLVSKIIKIISRGSLAHFWAKTGVACFTACLAKTSSHQSWHIDCPSHAMRLLVSEMTTPVF